MTEGRAHIDDIALLTATLRAESEIVVLSGRASIIGDSDGAS
jgi:hypothetical protein